MCWLKREYWWKSLPFWHRKKKFFKVLSNWAPKTLSVIWPVNKTLNLKRVCKRRKKQHLLIFYHWKSHLLETVFDRKNPMFVRVAGNKVETSAEYILNCTNENFSSMWFVDVGCNTHGDAKNRKSRMCSFCSDDIFARTRKKSDILFDVFDVPFLRKKTGKSSVMRSVSC